MAQANRGFPVTSPADVRVETSQPPAGSAVPGTKSPRGDYIAPPVHLNQCQASPPSYSDSSPVHISEEQARAALIDHVDDDVCCYCTNTAKELSMNQITPFNSYHYKLESFIETRSVKPQAIPYLGDHIDGPENGKAQEAWDVECKPEAMFKLDKKLFEVKHTAEVRLCGDCNMSTGIATCRDCIGSGTTSCFVCGGSGTVTEMNPQGGTQSRTCHGCRGSRRTCCMRCSGNGRCQCSTCEGRGKMKLFQMVTIEFHNVVSEKVVDHSELGNVIRSAGGKVIMDQTARKLAPITDHQDRQLCDATASVQGEHKEGYKYGRLLMQRQTLRVVPVSKCSYTWSGKQRCYWVYGTERKVDAPDYPCCGGYCCCCDCCFEVS